MNAAIEILQRANDNMITSEQINSNPAYRENLTLLLQAGLIKLATTEEARSYEITEVGSIFRHAYEKSNKILA
jgi:predicted transcriptional regulator